MKRLLLFLIVVFCLAGCSLGEKDEEVQEQPGYSSPQLVVSGICDVGNNIVAAGGVLRDEDNQALGRALMSNGDITSRMIYEGIVKIINVAGDKGELKFEPGEVLVNKNNLNAKGSINAYVNISGYVVKKEIVILMRRLPNPVTTAWYVAGIEFY